MEIPTLHGDGVMLRPPRPHDAPALAAAFAADPELGRLVGEETDPDEAAVRARMDKAPERARDGKAVTMTIADAESDACLGSLIVHTIDEQHRRAEIGLYLVPAGRRRGVATNAMRATLEWLFETVGFERVELSTTTDNATLPRLAERLGFVHEGTARGRNFERGRRVDLHLFGLLRDEWR